MRLLTVLFLAAMVLGCSAGPPADSMPPEGTAEFAPANEGSVIADSDDGVEAPVYVIDVRSQAEWDGGHLEQAVHIPHTEVGQRIGEVTDAKDAKIIVYCAVGGRAGMAKTTLEQLGFTNVENGGGYSDMKTRYK